VKDKIDSEEVTIEVEAMDGMRIDRLRLTRIEVNKSSQ